MKTDDLIASLSRDAAATGPDVHRRLALAFLAAAAAAGAVMLPTLGIRPDIAAASTGMLFPLKILAVATLAVGAMALVRAAARPEADLPRGVLVVPVVVLLVALGHEVATQVPANLSARMIGRYWGVCLIAIPLLGLIPLAAILGAMRAAAPRHAARAGALAGFAAGAIAATAYGLHCTDDSPLFVIVWYGTAIALLASLGALLGRRLLAW
ncbi:NrsF family protein [Phreatobacter sp.]|uniref:NrsF family protein n=1 Tax=Phreatobacter sp. TaxID=1966341 RepID=UPI0022C85ECC|nr:NrsF family protein [Phreatobacter sp.]MCZ8315876.1 NrsF family protein [Phreatobacter sp.]